MAEALAQRNFHHALVDITARIRKSCTGFHELIYIHYNYELSPSTIIGASEASPFLVMNVAILCVCVCVCVMDRHDICFLYS